MVELGQVRFGQAQDQIGSGQIWAGTGQGRTGTGHYLLFVWVILLVVLALDSRMVLLVALDQYYLGSTVSLASKQYILFEVFLNQQQEPASGDRM